MCAKTMPGGSNARGRDITPHSPARANAGIAGAHRWRWGFMMVRENWVGLDGFYAAICCCVKRNAGRMARDLHRLSRRRDSSVLASRPSLDVDVVVFPRVLVVDVLLVSVHPRRDERVFDRVDAKLPR